MRLKQSKALSLISLATKAGKTVSGEFSTEKETKSGRAELVIVAEDASDNTKKKFQNMCDFYEVPIYFIRIKIRWGMQWEKNSGHRLPCWMQDLQRELRSR